MHKERHNSKTVEMITPGEYKLAFPAYPDSAEIIAPYELVALINELWSNKDNDFRVLCFGYGFGQTEVHLLRAIEEALRVCPRSKGKVQVVLRDTKNSKDLFGELYGRPKIECGNRIEYLYEWCEDVQSNAEHKLEYDIVTAYFCLHFMPDWPSELRQLARCVKPGGLISFAIERGYRAWIDGATHLDIADSICECRNFWRNYHDFRIEQGDGWLPDISASNMGAVASIISGEFDLVRFSGQEHLRITYPDNRLTRIKIEELITSGKLFFPLINSRPSVWKKNVPTPPACTNPHKELADLFFLKRQMPGELWLDDGSYKSKVNMALLSSAIRMQSKITLPILQPGLSDEQYQDELRARLRSILTLLGMHILRHCKQAACELVFVRYTKMAELYAADVGSRNYLSKLPMVVFGQKAWRTEHNNTYNEWRHYLSHSEIQAWIGQYVMELFPWVAAWEIRFDGDTTSASIKKHRNSPHCEGQQSVWQCIDKIDVLEIVLRRNGNQCTSSITKDANPTEHEFEWTENTDKKLDEERRACKEGCDHLREAFKNEINIVLKDLIKSEGHAEESVPQLLQLSGLLSALHEINMEGGNTWHRIYYLAVPQASVRKQDSAQAITRTYSGLGVVFYVGSGSPYSVQITDTVVQLIPSILRMSQLQFQYLYLHEKQIMYLANDIDEYFELSDIVIDELYAAVFPEGEDAIALSRTVKGIPIPDLYPAHKLTEFTNAVGNYGKIKTALSHEENILNYLTACGDINNNPERFKAALGRHKGSFVPIDLAEYLFRNLSSGSRKLNNITGNVIQHDKAWGARAANSMQYVFWDVYKQTQQYIASIATDWKCYERAEVHYKFSELNNASLIRLSWHEKQSGEASRFIRFAGDVMRGAIAYGGRQVRIQNIIDLRERLGCNQDLGVYESFGEFSREAYVTHGMNAKGPGGIAIWFSKFKSWIDLVIFIEHRSGDA